MLFSLIVPVFNTKDYLEQCLSSIVEQNFEDYELILVDDGSYDGSQDICDKFCEGKANYRVIHQENRGLSGARNTGIKEAKGDWIWFIDSDDFIMPGALSALQERMRFANGDMYVFQYYRTDEKGDNSKAIFFREFQEIYRLDEERYFLWNMDHRLLQYKDSWEACFRLFKREIILDNKLHFKDTNIVFAEDLCFVIEYMMYCRSEVMLVNYLYCYRFRGNSLVNTAAQKEVLPKMFNLLEETYKEAKKLKKRQIMKNFDAICFRLISTHITKLNELTDEELCLEIAEGTKRKLIGKQVRKVKDKLLVEIANRG